MRRMEIEKDSVVTMHYTLTSPDGEVLDSSREREPLAYLHGHKNIIPGLENRLEGETSGKSLQVRIPAIEGYGEHDPKKILPATRQQFPPEADLQVGMQFQANGPQGPMVVRVQKIEGEEVTLDANHPLAGIDLTFDVDIVDVRDATYEEIEHGHVHGPGGHEH